MRKLFMILGIFVIFSAWFLSGRLRIGNFPLKMQIAYAAISYVGGQVGSSAGTNSNTTVSFSLTGGTDTTPQAGDLIIVAFSNADTVDKTLTIKNPSAVSYTIAGDLYQNGSSFDSNFIVGYEFMPATPETSVILAGGDTSGGRAWSIHVFRGVDQTTPLDVAAVTAGGISSHLANPGAITPSTSGAIIYVAGAGATTTGASYTAAYLTDLRTASGADSQDADIGTGYVVWTSGTYDPAAFTGGGTNSSSDSWNAVTLALKPLLVPTVTTQAASSVKDTTATANGNITATGGGNADEEGFVYDTATKSLPGNVAPASSGYASVANNTGSFGTGAFTTSLTGLSGGVTYFGRAYAHNSAGYSYGSEVSFTTAVISVSVADGIVSYGLIAPGSNKDTTASGLNDTQTVTNSSTIAEDFTIKGQNTACPWTLGSSAATDQYVHAFSTNSGTNWTALTTNNQTLATNIAALGTQTFDLRLTMPTSTNCYTQQSVDVTITATAH